MDYQKQRIEPDQHYSDTDVRLMLDISSESQRRARESGKLKFVQHGTIPQFATFTYKGADILAWLDGATASGGSNTSSQASRGAGRSVAPASHAAITPAVHAMSDAETVEEFNRRISSKKAAGLDHRNALRAVVSEDPELHQAFLVASNRIARTRSAARL